MTRTEAHEILDAARAGVDVSSAQIKAALRATGDLASTWKRAPDPVRRQRPAPAASVFNVSARVLRGIRVQPEVML